MTTNQVADSIDSGDRWYFSDLTYSFKSSRLPYELKEDFQGSRTVSLAQQVATHKIFDYIENLLNLTFTYTTDIGDIVISSKDMYDDTIGYAYMPGVSTLNASGDIYITSSFTDKDYDVGGMGWSTLVHEIGHALGLDHPYGVGDYPNIDINDTVMSYNEYIGYDSFNSYHYSTSSFTTYQSADIITLQKYYGADKSMADDMYDLSLLLYSQKIDGYLGFIEDNLYTIDDKGGFDTISLEHLIGNHNQYLDINSSNQSVIINDEIHHYLTLTQDTLIEDVIGSNGADTIVLNNQNNEVDALSGFDTIKITNTSTTRIDLLQNKLIVSNKTSGFDTLINIEELYINDNLIDINQYSRNTASFANHESASTISRLYLATFNRLADGDGLVYWLDEYQSQNNITNIASSFVISNEFQSLYGSTVSDKEYISLLYQNILYRDADADGLSYWLEDMQNNEASKAELLVSFSNSDEFITLTSVYFDDNLVMIL